jgi:enoyl-CoA hydratase/carnithine racemase
MDKVRVEHGGAVRQVMLARADKRNALDADMLIALAGR